MALEDSEVLSHELPYWDDAPQAQSRSQIYTEEEVQELVDKAYQEGWQQGIEEGYKLGREKGYKEYKVQEEEEAKKAGNQVNEVGTMYQSMQNISSTVTRANATPQTDPAASKVCARSKTAHTTPNSSISSSTTPWGPELFSVASRSSTSSITRTYSSPNAQNNEIDDLATYSSSISSNTTQTTHLPTKHPSNDVSDCYVVHFDSQITPSSNQSDEEKNRPLITHIPEIPEHKLSDLQNDDNTSLLVNVDTQEPTPASGTSTTTEKNSPATFHISNMPHQENPECFILHH